MNKEKCVFAAEEVKFLGHIITAEGVKSDPDKVKAIVEMETPQTKVELQRFLGMINYLGKFVPNLSEKTAPLRELLKKDIDFVMENHNLML